jgi:predicted metal-dependent HD superfamily phosphohydrolase
MNGSLTPSIQVNETTAFVALTNATYEFVHYNRYTKTTTTTYHWVQIYYYEPGKGYVLEPPRLQYTTSSSSTSYDGHGTVA